MQLEAGQNAMSAEYAPALTEFNNKFGETFSQLARDAADSGLVEVFAELLEIVTALAPALEIIGDIIVALKPYFEWTGTLLAAIADALRTIFNLVKMLTGPIKALVGAIFGLNDTDLGTAISNEVYDAWWDIADTFNGNNGAVARKIGNAAGTDNWSGGWTRVNENGLERIYLPSGSRIQTASETRYTSGDTYNTTVYVDHVEDLDTILRIAKNARITTRMGAK